MSSNETPTSVEAVKDDIETTRADLVDTVTELSDRLDPKKRVAAVTEEVTSGAELAVEHAQDVTKHAATKVQVAAKAGVGRGQGLAKGRERQIVVVAVVFLALIVGWRIRRRR